MIVPLRSKVPQKWKTNQTTTRKNYSYNFPKYSFFNHLQQEDLKPPEKKNYTYKWFCEQTETFKLSLYRHSFQNLEIPFQLHTILNVFLLALYRLTDLKYSNNHIHLKPKSTKSHSFIHSHSILIPLHKHCSKINTKPNFNSQKATTKKQYLKEKTTTN